MKNERTGATENKVIDRAGCASRGSLVIMRLGEQGWLLRRGLESVYGEGAQALLEGGVAVETVLAGEPTGRAGGWVHVDRSRTRMEWSGRRVESGRKVSRRGDTDLGFGTGSNGSRMVGG